ncbi:hypothetical protein FACS1894137_12480 [Spirochaetia bacterium]|nr:hypothetical protein FACS1894137_12480 [Spirochaetia bacterium]
MISIKLLIKKLIPKHIFKYRNSYLFYKSIKKTAPERLKRRTLLRFDVHLAEHCNLNCNGCGHFSPLAEKTLLDLSSFEKDCMRLSYLTNGEIEDVSLCGGEPLLHPEIIGFLRTARKYFKKLGGGGMIRVITNGMLLASQKDDFWKACNQNQINIEISLYNSVKIDFEKIKQLAINYDVNILFRGDISTNQREWWRKPLDITGKQKASESFKTCDLANTCIQLVDGRLYPCSIVAYIKYFNKYFMKNLQVNNNDYIDIYKVKNLDEIFDFLSKPIPFCSYCNTKKVSVVDWHISKKDINEWISYKRY